MSLRTRLQRLGSLATESPRASDDEGPQHSAPGRSLGDETFSPRLLERRCASEHRHGDVSIGRARAVDARHIAKLALDPALANLDLERALYLDTETTGLAGGSGTLPFVIGLGLFHAGETFLIEQLIVPEPGQERAALHHLAERIASSSCLVTYNGKSFDWPLLRTRFVLNRIAVPKIDAHVDLLHATRRVYRRRLGEVRLGHVEREVLGFAREGDIDGSEIPQRYFDFLRRRDWTLLTPVIEHNALDLLALAALIGHLDASYESPQSPRDTRDQLGFAKVAARARDRDRARDFAYTAATGATAADSLDALRLLAMLHRQAGRHADAVAALGRCLEVAGPPEHPQLHLALAKIYEHQLRQHDMALSHAREAHSAEPVEVHTKRLERLGRRLART